MEDLDFEALTPEEVAGARNGENDLFAEREGRLYRLQKTTWNGMLNTNFLAESPKLGPLENLALAAEAATIRDDLKLSLREAFRQMQGEGSLFTQNGDLVAGLTGVQLTNVGAEIGEIAKRVHVHFKVVAYSYRPYRAVPGDSSSLRLDYVGFKERVLAVLQEKHPTITSLAMHFKLGRRNSEFNDFFYNRKARIDTILNNQTGIRERFFNNLLQL